MQEHTVIGSECLKQMEARLGNSNFLQMARQIALYHHERWDGRTIHSIWRVKQFRWSRGS